MTDKSAEPRFVGAECYGEGAWGNPAGVALEFLHADGRRFQALVPVEVWRVLDSEDDQ